MTRVTPQDIIRREYGYAKNFMTPHVIRCGPLADGAYELSSGKGISGDNLFGISVVHLNPDGTTERLTDECRAFHTRAQAEGYIAELKVKHKGYK